MSSARVGVRRKHLAICLSGIFALAPHAAICTTRVVNTCADDNSAGSLRQQIAVAAAFDTIDLSTAQLACSTITLTQGEIQIPQAGLGIYGPTDRTVTITTSTVGNRLLNHTYTYPGPDPNTSFLIIRHLTFSGAYYSSGSGNAKGGCIASGGNVYLDHSTVSGCTAYTNGGAFAAGGAIYSKGRTRLISSVVTGNKAYAFYNSASGGGVAAGAYLYIRSSTLSGNSAVGGVTGVSRGGGANVAGLLYLHNSTVDANTAQQGAGLFQSLGFADHLLVVNSTISGNLAASRSGGIETSSQHAELDNSTIAFNSAPIFAGIYSATSIKLQSSIIAMNANTSPGGFSDINLGSGGVLNPAGLDNLIMSYSVVPATGVITVTADPQLTPLASHGGPTRTHALQATSPAIGHGNNTASQAFDQRLDGFPRVVNGTADIGAYERQANDDEIFYGGFD